MCLHSKGTTKPDFGRLKIGVGLLLFLIALLVFDAFTKKLAVKYLMGKGDIILIPGVLQLHYLENTGAAFGVLKGKLILFYLLTLIISSGIILILLRLPNKAKYLPFAVLSTILLAGAIGNLTDRIRLHYVVDFIYFSLIHFPVFNVADIYVTCSVFVLVLLFLFYYDEHDVDIIFNSKNKLKDNSSK